MASKKISKLCKGPALINAFKRIESKPLKRGSTQKINPTAVDLAIKINLKSEMAKAIRNGTRINAKKLYEGICTYTHFYQTLQNKSKLRWISMELTAVEMREVLRKNGKLFKIMDTLRKVTPTKRYFIGWDL